MDSNLIIKNYVSFRRRNVSKLTIYSKKILIYFVFKALNKLYSEWLHNKMLSKYNSDKKLKRGKPENLTRGREGRRKAK